MLICDFPGSRVIGPPRNWDQELDGSCGTIFVADAIDLQSGLNFMYSFYKPTAEDLEALNQGGVLRLGIQGMQHPIFSMVMMAPELTKKIDFQEAWDLGGAIHD